MKKENDIDIEAGIMGHEFYLRMLHDLLGDNFDTDILGGDGSLYMGDDIWLTVDGEFICEEK